MNTFCKLVLLSWSVTCLSACDDAGPDVPPVQVSAVVTPATETREERTTRLWSASCALCHVTGIGGAPHMGRADEWQPRLAQGEDVLMRHTLEGFNNMPPLGYCMACEREDFVAMIDLMTAGISAATESTP